VTAPTSNIEVVVPAEGRLSHVAPASGIVCAPDEGGGRLIYFEGNKYGSESLAHWADRVYHAAGRLIERYPTVARMTVAADDVVTVGHLDCEDGEITLTEPGSRPLLAAWLGVEDLPPEMLRTRTVVRHMMRREVREAIASHDPRKMAEAAWMSRRYQLGIDVPGMRL